MAKAPVYLGEPENDKDRKKKKKVTWNKVFEDFKVWHPSEIFPVMKWEAADYAMIRVFLHDGRVLLYDYDTKETIYDPDYLETEE